MKFTELYEQKNKNLYTFRFLEGKNATLENTNLGPEVTINDLIKMEKQLVTDLKKLASENPDLIKNPKNKATVYVDHEGFAPVIGVDCILTTTDKEKIENETGINVFQTYLIKIK